MVKTPHFHCRGCGSNPGRGTKMMHPAQHGQKKKKRRQSSIADAYRLTISSIWLKPGMGH